MPIKTTETDSGVVYNLDDFPLNIHMPKEDVTVLLSEGVRHFDAALTELENFLPKKRAITTDSHLSEAGKAAKLKPLGEALIDRTAAIWATLQSDEYKLGAVEAEMLAPPKLDNAHTVMGIEDSEVRSYWRSLPSSERLKIMEQMQGDPERHTRIALALLRSPIELIDHEAKLIRAIWDDRQRAKNPELSFSIEVNRKAIEYARRGVVQAGQHVLRNVAWKSSQVLTHLVKHPNDITRSGYGVFGFSPDQVRHEKHLQRQLAAAGRA